MNYDDIQKQLQSMKRPQLTADRKAILRERLVTSMAKETNSARHGKRHHRPIKPYAYSAAGIMAAAGVICLTIWGQTTGRSEMGGATSASSSSAAGTSGMTGGVQKSTMNGTSSSTSSSRENGPMNGMNTNAAALASALQMSFTQGGGGWAIQQSGHILHTTDNGRTWQDVTPKGVTIQATSKWMDKPVIGSFSATQVASFVSAKDPRTIYTTTTGGSGWHHATIPVANGQRIDEIQFVDAKNGFAVVEATSTQDGFVALYRTTNGGRSWQRVYKGTDGAHVQPDITTHDHAVLRMVNDTTGYRFSSKPTGAGPFLMRTTDGGATWSPWNPKLPVPSTLRSATAELDVLPEFFGTNGLWPVEYRTAHGIYLEVYHSSDKGATWRSTAPYQMPMNEQVDVYFSSPTLGWLVEHQTHTLMGTTDGGQTWNLLGHEPRLADEVDIQFSNPSHGMMVLAQGAASKRHVWQTDDGGRNWKSLS